MGNATASKQNDSYLSKSINLISFDPSGNMIFDNTLVNEFKDIKFKVKIISIIGEARMGKSSMLNMLISYIMGTNQCVFNIDPTNDHCTNGINIAICKAADADHGYMFIDCQGINHLDSSNDVKVLLLPYLLSDMLIFNGPSLNNSTLKLLEPLLSLCNHFNLDDYKEKPELIFRIKDYYLDTAVDTVLADMLTERKDQYQSIRNTILTLFNTITATSTDTMDKKTIKLLNTKKYQEIINSDLGFKEAIEQIINNVSDKQIFINTQYISKIKDIIKSINDNKKIDHKLFDTYSLIIRNDLNDFLNGIDKTMYSEIIVTGYQIEYDDIITSRKAQYDDIIAKFNLMFDKVDPKIKEEFSAKIDANIKKPIDTAIEELSKKATNIIHDNLNKILVSENTAINKLMNISTYIECFEANTDLREQVNTFHSKALKLRHAIYGQIHGNITVKLEKNNIYYQPIFNQISTYVKKILRDIEDKSLAWVNKLYNKFGHLHKANKHYINKSICYPESMIEMKIALTKSYEENIAQIKQFYNKAILDHIKNTMNDRTDFYENNSYVIDGISCNISASSISLTKILYDHTSLIADNTSLVNIFIESKESIYPIMVDNCINEFKKTTEGKKYMLENISTIIMKNPSKKFTRMKWYTIGSVINTTNDANLMYDMEMCYNESDVIDLINKYITVVDKRFNTKLMELLFAETNNNYTVYNFSGNIQKLQPSPKKHSGNYILDMIRKYHINKCIDSMC
jgi:hypothetical protein